jgi:hypothetical protein
MKGKVYVIAAVPRGLEKIAGSSDDQRVEQLP